MSSVWVQYGSLPPDEYPLQRAYGKRSAIVVAPLDRIVYGVAAI